MGSLPPEMADEETVFVVDDEAVVNGENSVLIQIIRIPFHHTLLL